MDSPNRLFVTGGRDTTPKLEALKSLFALGRSACSLSAEGSLMRDRAILTTKYVGKIPSCFGDTARNGFAADPLDEPGSGGEFST
jgi:hypothetical protein